MHLVRLDLHWRGLYLLAHRSAREVTRNLQIVGPGAKGPGCVGGAPTRRVVTARGAPETGNAAGREEG